MSFRNPSKDGILSLRARRLYVLPQGATMDEPVQYFQLASLPSEGVR